MGLTERLRTKLIRLKARRTSATELIQASGLFDADWYDATYRSGNARGDAIADYCGAPAGSRNPNPLFDTAWYLERNADVRAAGLDPLMHYLSDGAAEGRDPGPGFATSFYLASNPAVAAAGLNPLAHYLGFGRAEGRAPLPGLTDELDAYEAAVAARRSVAAAAEMEAVHFPLRRPTRRQSGAQDLPLPPLRLAQRIGAPTLEEFEEIGRGVEQTIRRCLPDTFDFKGARVLDFGCGVGRVIRYFAEEAKAAEIWGCELDGPSTRWNVENLSPPFRFFQISEIPTIPLEPDSFDLVYAISVFAHIHVDWHHWMMEIRRILKPGGYAFISFMAQTPHDEMLDRSYEGRGASFGKVVQNPFADWNQGGPMAFHHPDWVSTYWGSLFDIEFIALDGLLEYQSICFMRKPPPGAQSSLDVPVLRRSGAQRFDPDATGRLHDRYDVSRPYLDSYGVELSRVRADPDGEATIGGWIVFRGEEPAGLHLRVDDVPVPSRTTFEAGGPYRSWPETRRYDFLARAAMPALEPGEHRLAARLVSASGRTHDLAIPLLVR